jgi:cytochrome c peroxidase
MKSLLSALLAVASTAIAIDMAHAEAGDSAAQNVNSGQLPNNFPLPNSAGFAATYSTRGFLDFTTPFHQALGTNGRSCGSCHVPNSAWSLTPADARFLFLLTGGTHPLFNPLDAVTAQAPVETVRERRAAYRLLLEKGLFRRTVNLPATREFDLVAVDDPHGNPPTMITTFRRPLGTTNLAFAAGVHWDVRTAPVADLHQALINQVQGNVTAAQQGSPPTQEVKEEVVTWEESLTTAQVWVHGVGSLDRCGARGGPEFLAQQPKVAGRFDLFDAWIGLVPGSCTDRTTDRKRAQIARGQELFNTALNATGRTCSGCHNVANNGTNMNGTLFNIGTSAASRRTPDLPLYTLQSRIDGSTVQTTDPGRAVASGLWNDMSRFKVPSLRGLAARAPYFHNGIAATLEDVVHLYEESLGFDFTLQEEEDLVAFLRAL